MDQNTHFRLAIQHLRKKNYVKAFEHFQINFSLYPSPQSFEALYNSLIHLISAGRSAQQDLSPYISVLSTLITQSRTSQEVLGFTYSTLSKSKLNKRFKILALIFHPDKGSFDSDIFIKVKSSYDELNAQSFSKSFHREEFFNKTRSPSDEENEELAVNPFLLFSLFPMIMLLAISVYSTISVSPYSLERTLMYSKCTDSSNYQVRFCFDPENFEAYSDIEKQVEQDWIDTQTRICNSQLSRLSRMQNPDSSLLDFSSCEILRAINKYP